MNKFGKKVASKVTRLQESLAKIDTRVDVAVRRARESAAADPSKLSRVAAVEEAGRVERAALLAKPYDPQPPQSTVGAKRKRETGARPVRGAEVRGGGASEGGAGEGADGARVQRADLADRAVRAGPIRIAW